MTDALIALAVVVASRWGQNPDLFCRLIEAESNWEPSAVSETGCVGLGQISQKAWSWYPSDPFDPMANLSMSASILAWNMAYRADQEPDEQRAQAVASYVIGHGAVNKLIAEYGDDWRDVLSEPVRRYVEKVANGTR